MFSLQVSHGVGSSVEESHNAAAALALAALADSGIECGKEGTSGGREEKQKPAAVVNGSSSEESSGSKSRTLTPGSAKKKKAKEGAGTAANEPSTAAQKV